MGNLKRRSKKTAVGVIGGLVLALGLIAIPYPGPGWLIVFAGLGILSTEFEWAQRVLASARQRYDAWQAWLASRPLSVRILVWTMTTIVVIVTIYLLNGYGLINEFFNLRMDWLTSPLFN